MFRPMAPRHLATLVTACMLVLTGTAAQAQEFSADILITAAADASVLPGKLYVSHGKVRIETPDVSGFFLVDVDAGTSYLVRPAQRTFMDAKQSSRLTQIFVPVDPRDACRRWQSMAEIAGMIVADGQWVCEPLGRETVEDRGTAKYRIVSPANRLSFAWIDTDLGYPIKMQVEDKTVELKNIQEGQSPASLFEVPRKFSKFDPRYLIERIKQSDVWVEPPPE
jgi:hypothetical protein